MKIEITTNKTQITSSKIDGRVWSKSKQSISYIGDLIISILSSTLRGQFTLAKGDQFYRYFQ